VSIRSLLTSAVTSSSIDAIKLTKDDRRFAVFYTAQQTVEDIYNHGMGGDYFPKLYGWLHQDGYAIVNDFLSNYPIPDEHNPTTMCRRAPTTTSSADAIMASMGIVEQEILEAISAEHIGFRGGWVSSIWLDRLIESMNKSNQIARNKRGGIMESIGYELHPECRSGGSGL